MNQTAVYREVGQSPSLRARLAERVLRQSFRRIMSPSVPISVQRRVASVMKMAPLPSGVKMRAWTPFDGAVPGEVFVPKTQVNPRRVVLYFHGGGYTICSPQTHRGLIARIARESGLMVFSAGYRLAPEHMYPAQLEDALGAWDAVIAEGFSPAEIYVGGDSAGGNLALALSLKLKELGRPLPGALVLISPAVDFTFRQVPDPCDDALLPLEWVLHIRQGHCTTEQQESDPLLSCILSDLKGLPPVYMQSSSVELLANDARRLYEEVQKAGGRIVWEEQRGLWHDFQMQAGLVPEADEAVQRIGRCLHQFARLD